MGNIREKFRDYCEKKQNVKFPEEPFKRHKIGAKNFNRQEYAHNYYINNKEKLCEYAKNWYEKNKERLACKLTKFQELLYNYYLSTSYMWFIPELRATGIALWKTTSQIFRSTESLVKKWKLIRSPEGYKLAEYVTPVVSVEPLFDANEPDLYEDVVSTKADSSEAIKRLEDEKRELNRKLKNAEERYLKLLWEYTRYKESVKTAYINYEVAEKVRNDMMWELDDTIMER